MARNQDRLVSSNIQIGALRDRRKAHLLSETKSGDRPQNIIFVDTETEAKQIIDGKPLHQLKLGVARYYRTNSSGVLRFQRECVFYTPDDFAVFVNKCTRSKTVTYLVAHNIKFDSLILRMYDTFIEHKWELRGFYFKGTVAILRWARDDRKLFGLDNSNFFTGTLSDLGKLVDLPKLTVNFDTVTNDDLITYCRRDVEIMYRLWVKWLEFLDTHDCGKFCFTISATAMYTFRHRFMRHKIYIDNHRETSHLEKLSYHGGRTQAFWIGHRENDMFYHVDVNSMYPHVMSQHKFPCERYGFIVTDRLSKLESLLRNNAVVAYVHIKTDTDCYPLAWEGRLIFPIGEFYTTLTTPEIHYALEHNHIKKLLCFSWYQQQPIFAEYSRYWYDLRLSYKQKDNAAFDRICKLMGNGLYGKFAQTGIHQHIIGDVGLSQIENLPCHDYPTMQPFTLTAMAGKVYQTTPSDFGYNAFPAIASHVTAYARMYLWLLMQIANRQNVLYVDTDCLIVNQRGFDNLSLYWNETKLGGLKIEKQSNWITIHGAKDYEYEGTVKCKGIRSNAALNKDGDYVQDRFYGIQSMINEHRLDGVFITPIAKHLNRVVHSGVLLPGGWVAPFVFRAVSSDHVQSLP